MKSTGKASPLVLHEEPMGTNWRKPTDTMHAKAVNITKVGNVDCVLFQSKNDPAKVSGSMNIHIGGVTEEQAKSFMDAMIAYLAEQTGSDIGPSTYRRQKTDKKEGDIADVTK